MRPISLDDFVAVTNGGGKAAATHEVFSPKARGPKIGRRSDLTIDRMGTRPYVCQRHPIRLLGGWPHRSGGIA